MTNLEISHRDLENEHTTRTTGDFGPCDTDAQVCNKVRDAIMKQTGLELDEIDMDDDGDVTRTGDSILIHWTGERSSRSLTTIK